ncbi:MAG: hypothetical protein AAF211_17705 [Myxococcota bacterium]
MDTKRALRLLPGPDPSGERRILRRFARTRAERRHRVAHGLAFTALGLAAAVLLWALWPSPPRVLTVAAAEGTVERVLWSEGVDLTLAGVGEVSGTDDDVVVDWQSGALTVRVDPAAGVRLAVRADEGRVEVTGTSFTVVRDALGLTTRVERGSVAVACSDGTHHSLVGPNATLTCWPQSAARLLGRADTLEETGASSREVLDTLDRALGIVRSEGAGPVRGELLVRRMRVLAALGESGAALDDAADYLDGFDLRADEVHGFAAGLVIEARGDCRAALGHLAETQLDDDLRWLRDTCERRRDREPAALVDHDPSPGATMVSERVRRWARRLGEVP